VSEPDDELRLVVVELIKLLNDWSRLPQSEDECAKQLKLLNKWAKKTEAEYEDADE
jgi:hypothetical protein